MKKLIRILLEQLKTDFNPVIYGLVALFIAVVLGLNYLVMQRNFISLQPELHQFLFYFSIYTAGYFIPLTIYSIVNKEGPWKSTAFWIKSLAGITFLSLDSSLPFFDELTRLAPIQIRFWVYKVSSNLISFPLLLIPLIIVYWLYDKQYKHWYGFALNSFSLKPYFIMLGIMVPIVIGASFHPSFSNAYPQYSPTFAHQWFNVPEWVTVIGYEIAYGADFITVEFLFRGFFILGMMHYTGRSTILATATMYCFLHLGKPAGEAISSIFGGYILGTLAYQTRIIWGGVIVHLGIAWLMEIAGFMQKYIQQD